MNDTKGYICAYFWFSFIYYCETFVKRLQQVQNLWNQTSQGIMQDYFMIECIDTHNINSENGVSRIWHVSFGTEINVPTHHFGWHIRRYENSTFKKSKLMWRNGSPEQHTVWRPNVARFLGCQMSRMAKSRAWPNLAHLSKIVEAPTIEFPGLIFWGHYPKYMSKT